jgi:ribonucleotide reductase beta subunit family protein with ferritin-like domain
MHTRPSNALVMQNNCSASINKQGMQQTTHAQAYMHAQASIKSHANFAFSHAHTPQQCTRDAEQLQCIYQ